MYNTHTCDTCDYYDPIMKGKRGKSIETNLAWCAKHSVYPLKEGPGQKFPAGVKRVADAYDLAKPKIVHRGEVVSSCKTYKLRRRKLSKAALIEKLNNA